MRLDELQKLARRRRLDAVLVCGQANVRALTGVDCDNAVLSYDGDFRFHTDFRYVPMVHRVAPDLKVVDMKRLSIRAGAKRIGYESSVTQARFEALRKLAPRAKFVDVAEDLSAIRAVKTFDELERLRAAERLNCEIWTEARAAFRPGMTERAMARIIQHLMIERGEGEAFETIVCVGQNAAECHHEPDDTVWNGRESVLVDMGVRLDGVCSDLTRNIVPARPSSLYRRVYSVVQAAHDAAIAAARPGMTAAALDRVARALIRKEGFGKCFGHSLGHGVGFEIHEAPTVSGRSKVVLKPGMVVTIEPGIYLEGNLGVRIEDMIVITESGCELLSL